TFGHAIETGMGYGTWLHGEAVGTGMLMAADLSCRLGWLNSADSQRISHLIARAGLPTHAPAEIDNQRFIELMSVDKKVMDGKLRLVLLQSIGAAIITEEIPRQALSATLDHCRATQPSFVHG
ncbi:MAG TPA: 3-dehydroquinate synthase, partial [Gammaproteobacteria bacterium]|nr:3-dehydroquinate synthase [Gammaproteobacteria bacterium]